MERSEDAIRRVRALESKGKISPQEASRLINAIKQLTSDSEPQLRKSGGKSEGESGGTSASRSQRDRQHHHNRKHDKRRRQSQGSEWRWNMDDLGLGDQLGGYISDAVSNALNEMLGGDGHAKFRGIDGRWVNDTNQAQVSHLETPTGEGFTVENNQISAAHIAKLVLEHSRFVGNSLQGGRVFDLVLSNSEVSHNHLQGASIAECELVNSSLKNANLNAAAFQNLKLRDAEIDGGEWNGANMKSVVLIGSRLIEIEINGGRFKDVKLEADTVVERLRLDGSSWRRCTLSNTTFRDVAMFKQDLTDFACESSVLTDVQFKSDWQQPVKGLTMRNFQAHDVRFRDCRFGDTEFLDCAIDGLVFEGVDFTGLTLTKSVEFQERAKRAGTNRRTNHA